ncbi:MAG: hypothetical protein M3P84_03855 [Chloroflexota bacterium]|nr:hypothetical protein [Chloroflexota bacterium]
MTRIAPIDPLRRFFVRIVGRRPSPGALGADREWQTTPEQRLLDVVARHGPIGAARAAGARRASGAAAAGVRTVAPTEPSDEFAPTWVRRMADPGPADTEPVATAAEATRPQGGPRRPRPPAQARLD